MIVSSHHQAIERPAEGLRIVARAEDGVIEALEWEDPGRRPPLLLVQWHPERMAEEEGPLTVGIKEWFIQATRARAEQLGVATIQRTFTQPEGEQ
jgi:putative glutamine amidotransferase